MSSKAKILVVDDDRLVLATVTQGLVDAGYDVIDADNGDEAILLARQHRPDLALLDIRMEGLSGFDVAEYLKEVGQTPFVFLSAFVDADTRERVRELGALAYLTKPVDVRQLVPTVDEIVARVRDGAPAAQAGQAGARSGGVSAVSAASSALESDGAAAKAPASAVAATPSAAQTVPAAAAVAAASVASTAASRAASPAISSAEDLAAQASRQPLALALGILMHRFSLSLPAAAARLAATARAEGRSAEQQAARIVAAVQDLAG